MRILIAEDDWLHGDMLVRAMEARGHEVLGPAVSAEEALMLVEQAQPDLALVDIYLADSSSGLDLCESLWHVWRVPSLLVTGHDVGFNLTDAVGRVMKPFDPDCVSKAVDYVQECRGNGPQLVAPPCLQITPAGRRRLAV